MPCSVIVLRVAGWIHTVRHNRDTMSPIPAIAVTRFATRGRLCFSPFHSHASAIMGTTTAIAVMTEAAGDSASP
jgi:hypothetical protein